MLTQTVRYHVRFVNVDDLTQTWDMFLENRIPPLGENIRFNRGNTQYRIVDIDNDITLPVEHAKHGPTMGFYDMITIYIKEM